MIETKNKLLAIDGETLMDTRLEPIRFCVETLMPQGLCLLGGAPKIGKSWMVLDLCVRVAKGEHFLGCPTVSGTTLYLCLEDNYTRIQGRLNSITDDVPANTFFAISANRMADGLCDQIRSFCREHPDTTLVVIDTFQLIRNAEADASYANDYQEMQTLKALADELRITLLLVHHLRKQGDSDPVNKLSGTTGISGAVDAVYVLDKSRRNANSATLTCTGRDIEYREMELRFDKTDCVWKVERDSMETPEILLPTEMVSLITFMKGIGTYEGGNTEFAERYNAYAGTNISVKALKQMMNKWRYTLEAEGILFESKRSNGQRFVSVRYVSPSAGDGSDSYDGENGVCQICVPSVPCVPVQ